MKAVLTINAGSSSLKFALYEGEKRHARGRVERIGEPGAQMIFDGEVRAPAVDQPISNHVEALEQVLETLQQAYPDLKPQAIGHRIVHGGANFAKPTVITDAVLQELEELSPFAPLHQPHNLAGVNAAKLAFPGIPQIACFDTAFHRNHPWVNDTFALPRRLYDEGVRRYGFHGLSYEYISSELKRFAPTIASGRVVVAHLGNGASMCAIQGGRSVASTMGFSALDGLPMGTRSGQVDPGVLLYLMDKGMSSSELSDMLYRQSGLLGLSGLSNDMRTLESADTPEAREAIAYFTFRIQRELGGLAAAMGGIDALVFTGGIGENSKLIRDRVCERTEWMGLELDHSRNAQNARVISTDLSRAHVMVIPTNENLIIARAAADYLDQIG